MRVLHLMAGAAHGGAETACVDMCVLMKERGLDVRIATRPNSLERIARLEAAGIQVDRLPFGGPLDLFTPWKIARICREFRPQIVQTWMSRAAQKAPRWKPSTGIPRYSVVSRLGGYYKLSHFPHTDFFTTITPDIRRHLIESGVAPEKVRHINNFAETEEAATPVSRAALGTPEDSVLLLGLGRLHDAKAFDVLMRAVAPLPNVHVWIAGEGPARPALEALRAQLGLEERVKLLGWRDDRAALFGAADICVFCSRYEPFGTVFVQSWAQRVPVIVSDADGPRQFVRHEEDGLIVPADDPAALEAAISRLAADKVLREKLVRNGYERYMNEFTAEKTLQAYLDCYSALL